MYIYDTYVPYTDFFLRNATLFKIVFCYLYIEITFSYIYLNIFKSLSNITNLLIVFSHLFVFYYPFKSYEFFDLKLYY